MPRFKQVDVFTNVKYLGNPVAVIYDSDNLTTQNAKIARWTNLSETTFILTPKSSIADYSIKFSLLVGMNYHLLVIYFRYCICIIGRW